MYCWVRFHSNLSSVPPASQWRTIFSLKPVPRRAECRHSSIFSHQQTCYSFCTDLPWMMAVLRILNALGRLSFPFNPNRCRNFGRIVRVEKWFAEVDPDLVAVCSLHLQQTSGSIDKLWSSFPFREGMPDQKFPKYRHCLDGRGGLIHAWIFLKDLSTCTEALH